MIDTVSLVIHNIYSRYKLIYEQFAIKGRRKNQIIDSYVEVDADGVVTEKEKSFQRSVYYSDSGKFLPVHFTDSIYHASSHYTIFVRVVHTAVNEAKLEVEFSIPKYLYGTNVYQFLGYPEYSSEALFSKLLLFIDEWCRRHLAQVPLKEDIQIRRLDMCYNQFFLNKTEALEYQAAQRLHMENYCKAKAMRFVPQPGTDWSILTQAYSFKCYHKGSEFYKNDYKQLVKVTAKTSHDLSYIQEVADRVLRYEVTFRSRHIHYLTGYNFFDRIGERPIYVLQSNIYRYTKKVDKLGIFRKIGGSISVDATSAAAFFSLRQKHYFLASDYDKPYIPVVVFSSKCTFGYPTFRFMFDFFWQKVREAQIDSRSTVPEMVDKIKDYKKRCKQRKDVGMTKKGSMIKKGDVNLQRVLVPALLAQFIDLRELKGFLPQTTYYNLMRDLKYIGIPMKIEGKTLVTPVLNYEEYMRYLGNRQRAFL